MHRAHVRPQGHAGHSNGRAAFPWKKPESMGLVSGGGKVASRQISSQAQYVRRTLAMTGQRQRGTSLRTSRCQSRVPNPLVAPAQHEPWILFRLDVGLGLSGARQVCEGLFLGAADVTNLRHEDDVSCHGDAGESVQGHKRVLVVVRVEVANPRPPNHRLEGELVVVDLELGPGVVLVGELEYEFIRAADGGFAKAEACSG